MASRDILEMQAEQARWIRGILPNRDPRKTVIKLQTEVTELLEAILLGYEDLKTAKEIGDCFVLLLDICLLKNINPVDAFEYTMAINRGRDWRIENGSLTHIED